MFRQDLEVIDNLRKDAVNVREPHPSGIKKLQTYAGQLVWVGGKFPIDVSLSQSWKTWPNRSDWGRVYLVSRPRIQHRTTDGTK